VIRDPLTDDSNRCKNSTDFIIDYERARHDSGTFFDPFNSFFREFSNFYRERGPKPLRRFYYFIIVLGK